MKINYLCNTENHWCEVDYLSLRPTFVYFPLSLILLLLVVPFSYNYSIIYVVEILNLLNINLYLQSTKK